MSSSDPTPKSKKIIVTGGASFIGSHLVDRLLSLGHDVRIIDDFSSGSISNLNNPSDVTTYHWDLRTATPDKLAGVFNWADLIFHLAADHGGRGYVELKQVACSNNFAIDNNVLQAAILAEVPKLIFASSGCVYPVCLQAEKGIINKLSEDDLKVDVKFTDGHYTQISGYDPDGLYGLAKLAMELSLQHAYTEHGLESTSCRFFTVYGPKAKENHAIISFIARAFTRQDPWVVWGNGTQIRNWTYVDDIVNGMILSMDLDGCQALNIGTEEYLTVDEAIQLVLSATNTLEHGSGPEYNPTLTHDLSMPTGPLTRVASSAKYRSLGGTFTPFSQGLAQTVKWYYETHDPNYVSENLDRLLIARR